MFIKIRLVIRKQSTIVTFIEESQIPNRETRKYNIKTLVRIET